MLTILLGGARSGKSTAAVELARRSGRDVCFIATSPHIEGDADLEQRIAAHQAERPHEWRTVEEPIELAEAIERSGNELLIVDCLTVWVGNLMHHGWSDAEIDNSTQRAVSAARTRQSDTIVVTNEVGNGIVPADAMSRRYRDVLGRVNQRWVGSSDRALLMVAGRALELTDPLPEIPPKPPAT